MPLALTHLGFLASTITWDPFMRGILILALFIVLLPGSVFLVLSTDVGARLSLLLSLAAITGMMCLLACLWMPLASTADIGKANSWKPLEIITGNYQDQVTVKSAKSLPIGNLLNGTKPPVTALKTKHWYWPLQSCNDNSWHKIDPSLISDPESESDDVLANTSGAQLGPQLNSPFSATTDYVYIDGYRLGQNSGCLFAINRHKVYIPFARGPDIVVLRVLPALPSQTQSASPPVVQPNTKAPYTYVILERNLGSVRQPQAVMAISMGITFLVLCYLLHTREKERDRREEEGSDGPDGGGSGGYGGAGGAGGGVAGAGAQREPVGAGV